MKRQEKRWVKWAEIAADKGISAGFLDGDGGVCAPAAVEADCDWRCALANVNAPCPSAGGLGKPPSLPHWSVM